MDSINQHQPEDTRHNVQAAEAIQRIRETVEKTASCFFCTAFRIGDSVGARPMSVRKVDDQGHLWFLSASDSHKNAEIAADPAVTLYFQGSEHADFLQLRGPATILVDKATIKALWQPTFKTWFTDGIDDPRITAIEVAPASGYYWDNKHGNTVAGIKMLWGAANGKTLDDAIEGGCMSSRRPGIVLASATSTCMGMGKNMSYSELQSQYQNLRSDLEAAYASQVWDDGRIDFIANQLVETELAMARRNRLVTLDATEGAPP